MDSLLVPSSIQRIRSFLVEMCGMKVKPWASTEETLAALHTTLQAKRACGIFWDSLRTLLENLARDMKTRASADPGTLIDNEVLEGGRYLGLLDEIRQSLEKHNHEANAGSFRQLSATLSAPALGLLLLLGGVASVGCERTSFVQAPARPDTAISDADNSPCLEICGPATPADGGDAIVRKFDSQPATQRDTQPNTPADGPPRIVLRDTAPDHDAANRGADGGVVTIQDIMDSCNVPQDTQNQVRACLMTLDASWTSGMAQTLAGARCDDVNGDLRCFSNFSMNCTPRSDSSAFEVGKTRVCNPIIIYAGVRFV
jgi:hypothetical protein